MEPASSDDEQIVYLWADALYLKAGLEKERAGCRWRSGCGPPVAR